jgi:putative Holliday junction resolvase
MDGTRQELTDRAEKFGRALAGRSRLPVYLAEERLTTIEARSRSGLREAVDAVAAQIILEAWLADGARQETIIPDRQVEMEHG